ncbi:MAG: hypothetical protein JRJ21_11215 [Deltaproteobacteria bacterium]|nr:hypothetical protein [Deltaproteobacteria bacterium]
MTFEEKKERLKEIYKAFDREAGEYKKSAICKPGCAYKPLKKRIKKKIAQNKKLKEKGKVAQCPFLKEDKTCRIYDIRPFSCRQLYSLRECDGRGPTVHRQAVDLAEKTVQKLQQLDSTGYSGHISFVIHLLDKAEFRDLYLAGGFNPAQIMGFGKTHDIIINGKGI